MHGQTFDSVMASKWKALLSEYADVFEAPGKPVARAVDHRIDLLDPMAPLPHPWLYRISEDELLAVKHTISDYIDKGWIKPSSSSYGALVLVIRKKMGELHIVIDYCLLNK